MTDEDRAIVREANGRTWKIDNDVIALTFSVHAWGVKRKGNLKALLKARQALQDKEGEEKLSKLENTILISKEHDAIGKFMTNVVKNGYVVPRSVPSFFREGCYLFRLRAVEEVDTYLKTAQIEIRNLVREFVMVYPSQKDEARELLEPDGQYKESDYPSARELQDMFYISWQWISFDVPEGLPESVYAAEKSKAQNMWNDAAESITFALREAFKGLIAHAIDKLQVGADGKVKIFRDTTLTNITDFIATFKDRNITADSSLETLIKQADNILASVDTAKVLRDSTMVRDMVRTGFQTIEKQIDSLLVDKPIRKFNLDD
jgi:hypothetical protein